MIGLSLAGSEEFLDMVAGIQSSRMNDQRAELPRYPGLNSQEVITQYLHNQPTEEPDDAFFEMLMRCQVIIQLTALKYTFRLYFKIGWLGFSNKQNMLLQT